MKKYFFILLSILIFSFQTICFANNTDSNISYLAITYYCNEWNRDFDNNNYDLQFDVYCDNAKQTMSSIALHYNVEKNPFGCTIDTLPSDTSIFLVYDTSRSDFGFVFFSDSLEDAFFNISLYDINNQLLSYTPKILNNEAGILSFSLNENAMIDLFMTGYFKLEIQSTNASYILTFSENSHSIFSLMCSQLFGAYMYASSNSPLYLNPILLPEKNSISKTETSVSQKANISFQEDYEDIENKSKSVFYVEVFDSDFNYLGSASGFVIFDEHLFVTNQHVVEGASYLYIIDENNKGYILNKVIAIDKNKDLAILSFPDGNDYTPLPFTIKKDMKRGEPVTTIGSPKGMQNTVAFGNISALPIIEGISMIQFTAPISTGSSGGVLLDSSGNVIGITTLILQDGTNIGLAVPIDELYSLYSQWDKKSYFILGTPASWGIDITEKGK